MVHQKKFIAIDLGAENGRVVVTLLNNNQIEMNEVHRFTIYSVRLEDSLHWDIIRIFDEIITGLIKAQEMFGPQFDGIGVDTWGADYVLVDSSGNIIGFPYHYRDDRTDGVMEEAIKTASREYMYGTTGIQFAQFNTVFQLLSEEKKATNRFGKAHKMLLIPDFINYLLSGRMRAEFTIASTTGLTDPLKREWAWDIIDIFNLPRRIFPEIIEPGKILGPLLRSVSDRTGISPDTPVIATACHDTGSAVISVPAQRNRNWAFLSSGTWSLMGVELNAPILTRAAMEHNFTNEGGAIGTTRFLKNIAGLWLLQECRREWSGNSEGYSYADLVNIAGREGAVKAWVNLDDARFLKPGNMPGKIFNYLTESGQTAKRDVGFTVKVILESLAFTYRKVKKEIEGVTEKKINKLYVVGGGTQNALLMQLTANAVGCTVVAGATEGAALGNAGVQGLAVNAVSNIDEWRRIVQHSLGLRVYKPDGDTYFIDNEKAFQAIISKAAYPED